MFLSGSNKLTQAESREERKKKLSLSTFISLHFTGYTLYVISYSNVTNMMREGYTEGMPFFDG